MNIWNSLLLLLFMLTFYYFNLIVMSFIYVYYYYYLLLLDQYLLLYETAYLFLKIMITLFLIFNPYRWQISSAKLF